MIKAISVKTSNYNIIGNSFINIEIEGNWKTNLCPLPPHNT